MRIEEGHAFDPVGKKRLRSPGLKVFFGDIMAATHAARIVGKTIRFQDKGSNFRATVSQVISPDAR